LTPGRRCVDDAPPTTKNRPKKKHLSRPACQLPSAIANDTKYYCNLPYRYLLDPFKPNHNFRHHTSLWFFVAIRSKVDILNLPFIHSATMRFTVSVAVLSSFVVGVSAFVPQTSRVSFAPSSTTSLNAKARTLHDKIWDDHLVDDDGESTLLYVDRHLVHEVTSPQAFEGLRLGNRGVRRPDCTLVTVDHNVPTEDRSQLIDVQTFIEETASRTQVMQLEQNVQDFGLKYFGMADERQGIVHIIGPEQGFTLPGCVTVCGDSHTATHGAFGALAFGIGTSEVEHVLATQVSF
jgi:hypothetical protein